MKYTLRLTLASALLITSSAMQAQTTAPMEVAQLKALVATLQAQVQQIKTTTQAIGSVQQAFVTEAQFQAQMGSHWVLCDGRAVTGSSYEKLGYGSNIPDCTGRFLRSSGGQAAALRAPQAYATAADGLAASAITRNSEAARVHVEGSTGDAQWFGSLANRINDHGTPNGGTAYNGIEAWANGYVGSDATYWSQMFSHKHSVSADGSTSGGRWDTSVSLTSSATETRPANVTINTFIKIN